MKITVSELKKIIKESVQENASERFYHKADLYDPQAEEPGPEYWQARDAEEDRVKGNLQDYMYSYVADNMENIINDIFLKYQRSLDSNGKKMLKNDLKILKPYMIQNIVLKAIKSAVEN